MTGSNPVGGGIKVLKSQVKSINNLKPPPQVRNHVFGVNLAFFATFFHSTSALYHRQDLL